MAKWSICSDDKGQEVYVNLDNVTNMMWHDSPAPSYTEIVFVGGGQVKVKERPPQIIGDL
jgi:hypothetical protein